MSQDREVFDVSSDETSGDAIAIETESDANSKSPKNEKQEISIAESESPDSNKTGKNSSMQSEDNQNLLNLPTDIDKHAHVQENIPETKPKRRRSSDENSKSQADSKKRNTAAEQCQQTAVPSQFISAPGHSSSSTLTVSPSGSHYIIPPDETYDENLAQPFDFDDERFIEEQKTLYRLLSKEGPKSLVQDVQQSGFSPSLFLPDTITTAKFEKEFAKTTPEKSEEHKSPRSIIPKSFLQSIKSPQSPEKELPQPSIIERKRTTAPILNELLAKPTKASEKFNLDLSGPTIESPLTTDPTLKELLDKPTDESEKINFNIFKDYYGNEPSPEDPKRPSHSQSDIPKSKSPSVIRKSSKSQSQTRSETGDDFIKSQSGTKRRRSQTEAKETSHQPQCDPRLSSYGKQIKLSHFQSVIRQEQIDAGAGCSYSELSPSKSGIRQEQIDPGSYSVKPNPITAIEGLDNFDWLKRQFFKDPKKTDGKQPGRDHSLTTTPDETTVLERYREERLQYIRQNLYVISKHIHKLFNTYNTFDLESLKMDQTGGEPSGDSNLPELVRRAETIQNFIDLLNRFRKEMLNIYYQIQHCLLRENQDNINPSTVELVEKLENEFHDQYTTWRSEFYEYKDNISNYGDLSNIVEAYYNNFQETFKEFSNEISKFINDLEAYGKKLEKFF